MYKSTLLNMNNGLAMTLLIEGYAYNPALAGPDGLLWIFDFTRFGHAEVERPIITATAHRICAGGPGTKFVSIDPQRLDLEAFIKQGPAGYNLLAADETLHFEHLPVVAIVFEPAGNEEDQPIVLTTVAEQPEEHPTTISAIRARPADLTEEDARRIVGEQDGILELIGYAIILHEFEQELEYRRVIAKRDRESLGLPDADGPDGTDDSEDDESDLDLDLDSPLMDVSQGQPNVLHIDVDPADPDPANTVNQLKHIYQETQAEPKAE